MPVNALSAGESNTVGAEHTLTEQQTLDELNTENIASTEESNATSTEVATDSNATEDTSISDISSNDIDSSEEKLNNEIPLQNDETEDDEETSTDNWELGLVFYDSTVDNGKTPLTEIDWDASDGGYGQGTPRVITVQINYKNTNTVTTYQPGEAQIVIPNLLYPNESGAPQLNTSVLFGANDATHSGYDWDIKMYDSNDRVTTIYSPSYVKNLVLTNANTIEEKSNFEGSIKLSYTMTPSSENFTTLGGEVSEDECTHTLLKNLKATLISNIENESYKDIESNEIVFDYTRTYIHPWQRVIPTIEKSALKLQKSYDGLGENAEKYIWVFYKFHPSNVSSVYYPYISLKNYAVYDVFPTDCKVLSFQGNLIEPVETESGKYKFTRSNAEYTASGSYYDLGVYVGYPRDKYYDSAGNVIEENLSDNEYINENGNLIIRNTADLYGTYSDRDEEEPLDSSTVEIALNEFEFHYSGNLYGINKSGTGYLRYQDILVEDEYSYCSYTTYPTAYYTGNPMTLKIGDDLLYATDKTGGYSKLDDNEYYFGSIGFPTLYNGNGQQISTNKYDCELWVRYVENSEYTLYDSFKNSSSEKSWSFTKTNKVVGFYFIIKDMKESLVKPSSYYRSFTCSVRFLRKDIPQQGELYNFNYLQVYFKDGEGNLILQNEPGADSYGNIFTYDNIATYDLETYGTYMQRGVCKHTWDYYIVKNRNNGLITSKAGGYSNIQDAKNEVFKGSFNIRLDIKGSSNFSKVYLDQYDEDDTIKGLEVYDLLPKGMELSSTKEEIIKNLSLCGSGKNTSSIASINALDVYPENDRGVNYGDVRMYNLNGTAYTYKEFLDILKRNTQVEIIKNWNNTGRTLLKVIIDITDENIIIGCKTYNDSRWYLGIGPVINYDYEISYDSYQEYGNVYKNHVYAEFLNPSSKQTLISDSNYKSSSTSDSGYYDKDAVDINENGKTNDRLCYSSATTTINSIISSHQDVQTQVQTSKSNFTTDKATSAYTEEYTYKLRVRTGQNAVTNMVIANNIEMAYGNKDHWQGSFLGIDTSYIENKTWRVYEPKNENADEEGYVTKKVVVKPYYSTNPEETALYLSDQTIVEEDGKEVSKTIFKTDSNGNILKNTNWKEYTDSVDKSTVKSLAFELLDVETGEPAVIPADSLLYVLVKMQAPDDPYEGDDSIKDLPRPLENDIKTYTYNNCWTQWNPIDEVLNTKVDFVTGINSNIVRVRLFDYYDLTVNKTWDDENNRWDLRPDSIDIILKKSGIEIERKQITKDNPTVIFRNLLIDDSKLYSIEEEPSLNYEASIEYNELDDCYEVTNTLKDDAFTDISGTKTWVGDTESKRPESITINLLKDGKVYRTTTTNADKEWKYSFDKVPIYNADETRCIYSVEEIPIEKYTTQYTNGNGTDNRNGLAIKFNSQCRTESANYDYVEIYYKQDGQTFKLGKWGGTALAGKTVNVPTKDFYLYWRTDGSQCSYYGFSIDSIELAEVSATGTVATLPNYTATELTGTDYPESPNHGNYGNNVKMLWHYTGNFTSDVPAEGLFNLVNTYEGVDSVNISFIKGIEGTDEAFEKLKLEKDALYKFQVSMKNTETNDIISVPIDNKKAVTINEIPIGTYIITEKDDMFFDFVSMEALNSVEGITFEKVGNDYVLTITKDASEEGTLQIKVNNKIETDRPYEDKEEKENLFKYKDESIEINTYIVYWYDSNGNFIKTPETRTGAVGTTIHATTDDKNISGYKYDESNSLNIESIILSKNEGNKLKLYFNKL